METQVRERLIGALVLVAIVVLFVPALLKGPARKSAAEVPGEQQTIEFPLPAAAEPVRDEDPVPEPLAPPATAPAIAAAEPEPEAESRPAPPPEPSPAPARELAREPARTVADAPAPGAASGQPAWAVQLGAFSTREKAEGMVSDLRKRGYPAFVLEYRASGKLLHRVRVGPEQDRARAVAMADRLRKDGYLPVVAPHP